MSLHTLSLDTLVSVTGGQAQQQQAPEEPMIPEAPGRSWGQVAREYVSACVTGAGQSMMFGGKPRSVRDAATTAGIGCAMGVGMKGLEDVGRMIAGE